MMSPALFAAHRWLAIPLILFVSAILIGIALLVRGALDYAASRIYHTPIAPVIPMGPQRARPFSVPAAKGLRAHRKFEMLAGGKHR